MDIQERKDASVHHKPRGLKKLIAIGLTLVGLSIPQAPDRNVSTPKKGTDSAITNGEQNLQGSSSLLEKLRSSALPPEEILIDYLQSESQKQSPSTDEMYLWVSLSQKTKETASIHSFTNFSININMHSLTDPTKRVHELRAGSFGKDVFTKTFPANTQDTVDLERYLRELFTSARATGKPLEYTVNAFSDMSQTTDFLNTQSLKLFLAAADIDILKGYNHAPGNSIAENDPAYLSTDWDFSTAAPSEKGIMWFEVFFPGIPESSAKPYWKQTVSLNVPILESSGETKSMNVILGKVASNADNYVEHYFISVDGPVFKIQKTRYDRLIGMIEWFKTHQEQSELTPTLSQVK